MEKRDLKEKLAALLLRSGGEALSGEAASRELGVTRAAVWKAVDRLRVEGWRIDSATNRGYRLVSAPDILAAPLVEAFLPGPRKAPVLCYGELDSTNLEGQRLALAGAESGTAVLADRQTRGAGRMGRSFLSPGGVGVYLSYLLAPGCGGEELSLLTSCAGLAVCGAIRRTTGLEPAIKWPNDIILQGRKVCGILTKLLSDGENGRVAWAVIGIGVNVSQEEFPPELRDKAVSLRMAGASVPRARLAAEIISGLDGIFSGSGWRNGDPALIGELRRLSCTLGRRVRVISPAGEEEGEAVDIAPDGSLLVRFRDGVRPVSSGEVSVRGLLGYA